MVDKIVQGYLYDFYGELLNEHQRRIYEDFVYQDLSITEIASCEGISRQGVHDLIKRCTKTLEGYEEKLHLVEKFLHIKEKVETIHQITEQSFVEDYTKEMKQIGKISNEILEEL